MSTATAVTVTSPTGVAATSLSAYRRNVSPSVWGPLAWKLLYAFTQGYSDRPSAEERGALETMFQSLCHLLPCASCRSNLARELQKIVLQTDSARSASECISKLQNSVSVRLGKPAWTLNAALDHYKLSGTSTRAACGVRQDLRRDAWEPEAWKFLTAVAYAYPDVSSPQERDALRRFFLAMTFLMPHEEIRRDLSKQLELRPLDAETAGNRAELCDWLAALRTSMQSSTDAVEFEHMLKDLFPASSAAANTPSTTTMGAGMIALITISSIAVLALIITLAILYRRNRNNLVLDGQQHTNNGLRFGQQRNNSLEIGQRTTNGRSSFNRRKMR